MAKVYIQIGLIMTGFIVKCDSRGEDEFRDAVREPLLQAFVLKELVPFRKRDLIKKGQKKVIKGNLTNFD